MPNPEAPRIVVAMDYDNADDCLTMARRLSPENCRLKVGKELFTRSGPAVVEQLQGLGFDIFLDLKFHDIPNTTAGAVRAAAELGVWMVNVHASGGERMMCAAREALDKVSGRRPLLIGVTVLTSMTEADLHSVGVARTPMEQVLHLADLSHKSGLDGVVCSAQEARALSERLGPDFCLVTPGIRPADSATDDQRRTLTPQEAIAVGSHYLVIGRPITRAADPIARCREIAQSIAP
ncbi:orotidine-5'-phosphate decarboxylase [Marinimicrobium sp. C6131]|uniref:orotidine-5'-phosphate decarboxylase n=1 Tax=Marinimicrobium sp. C6131 TaxID=3022676 RepID=UPI00223E360F|nr:orotidine-5'-phosphate decarboxylase [Marinimicrobium sp. C6131]UZJ45264.1 orotidine-5'-phosphate decarboxylase [Marinimicrobium sp. C6131]